MSRPPPAGSVEDKLRIVLCVMSGEMTIAEAARCAWVSWHSIGRWKSQFIEGGKAGLAEGRRISDNPRERAMAAEIEDLRRAVRSAFIADLERYSEDLHLWVG